jgi:acid phosphatase family membrane protein YuiD
VQHHAKVINRHVLLASKDERVSEMVGHSLPEILAGLVVGGGFSALFTLLLE